MIDYWKRKIVFGLAKAARKSVRFERPTPFLTAKDKIARQEVRLLVDTGAAGFYRNRLSNLMVSVRIEPSLRRVEAPSPSKFRGDIFPEKFDLQCQIAIAFRSLLLRHHHESQAASAAHSL